MAVQTVCSNCKHTFIAHDEYLGERVKCPKCGTKVVVLSDEDRQEEKRRQEKRKRWEAEQERRISLYETLDKQRRSPRSYAASYGTGLDRVRNYNPGAITRFRKLRALSRFLLLGAYLLVALVLAGAGITIYLYREGVIAHPGILALALLGWLILLFFVYFHFKFLGEMSWLLADVGDHQLDVRNLLLDAREDFERELSARG